MSAGLNGIIFDDLEWSLPGFQGHCILTSRISQKRCVFGTKLL